MGNSSSQLSVAGLTPGSAVTLSHLLILLSLSFGAITWGATIIIGGEELQLQRYLALLGCYAAASAVFVFSRIRRGKLQPFEMPVFITALSFLQFGLAPLRNFIDPAQLQRNSSANSAELVRALSYFMLGMIAFWIGCEITRRREGRQTSSDVSRRIIISGMRRADILLITIIVYAVVVGTRYYLLKNQLYSYVGSLDKYYANLASMQVFGTISQVGTLLLVVATIERYSERHYPYWRILFVVVLSSEIFWGLISGMKGLVLQNFIVVALVASMIQGKFRSGWVAAALLGLIALYPLSNAYRGLIRGREAIQVTDLSKATEVTQMAFEETTSTTGGPEGWLRLGLDQGVARLNLLQSLAAVLSLGPQSAQRLQGTEHLWMIPYYSFIPRFLWPSKPVLDKGRRFSIALKSSEQSSTAITYPGDLCAEFGLPGILVGMLLLGAVAQTLTKKVSGHIDKRRLFIYAGIFQVATNMEVDAFSYWASLIKTLVIMSVVAWVIYGRAILPVTESARPQEVNRIR